MAAANRQSPVKNELGRREASATVLDTRVWPAKPGSIEH
jgi:hypothetical protein